MQVQGAIVIADDASLCVYCFLGAAEASLSTCRLILLDRFVPFLVLRKLHAPVLYTTLLLSACILQRNRWHLLSIVLPNHVM